MGDDQVVARELEQAEARLAGERFQEAERMALSCHQGNCKGHPDRVRDWGSCDCGAIEVMSDGLASVIAAAIEVGRLRALAALRECTLCSEYTTVDWAIPEGVRGE